MDAKGIARLIFEGLKLDEIKKLMVLIPEKLEGAKTEKQKFTKTPFLNAIGQELGKLLSPEKWKFDALMKLWKAGGRDEKLIAISALGKISKNDYENAKKFVLNILKDVSDWEICDQLALKVTVNLAVQDPDEIFALLKKWSESTNKWQRRLAAATVPPFIRAKKDESRRCLDLLNGLMSDSDRDVKKAVAWALREITKKDPEAVFDFLKKWNHVPDKNTRWIIKEGMKKLSPEQQKELLTPL